MWNVLSMDEPIGAMKPITNWLIGSSVTLMGLMLLKGLNFGE